MFNHTNLRRGLFGGLAAVALAAGAAVMTTPSTSIGQAQAEGQAPAAVEGQLRVGTYQPEQVFGAYHGREAFMQQFQELQIEAQQAQQEGNQERLMQIQQELQQAQQEVIETFQNDVEQVMPQVAQETNVQIVAVEVTYVAEGIQEQDVTNQVIEKLNEGQEAPQPVVPDMGAGQ